MLQWCSQRKGVVASAPVIVNVWGMSSLGCNEVKIPVLGRREAVRVKECKCIYGADRLFACEFRVEGQSSVPELP